MNTIAELLSQTPLLWERVEKTKKPIALFGMGDGADKIWKVLGQLGKQPNAVFASDAYARGNLYRGLPVRTYRDTKKEWKDMLVLVAFGSQRPEVLGNIAAIANEQELYVPDVPVIGDTLFTRAFVADHLTEFQQVYNLLADETSRRTYRNLIRFKLSGDPSYLHKVALPRKQIFSTIFPLTQEEIFVDAGAYTGDTIEEFLQQTGGRYQKILALEPNARSFRKLQKNTQQITRLQTYHLGAWSQQEMLVFDQSGGRGNTLAGQAKTLPNTPVDSIDNVLAGGPATYLKYDVEGTEREALEGSRFTITNYRPKLWISAYHRSEDLFALPLQLLEICPEYDCYIRHNPYLPAWDIHLLALPKGEPRP